MQNLLQPIMLIIIIISPNSVQNAILDVPYVHQLILVHHVLLDIIGHNQQ